MAAICPNRSASTELDRCAGIRHDRDSQSTRRASVTLYGPDPTSTSVAIYRLRQAGYAIPSTLRVIRLIRLSMGKQGGQAFAQAEPP